MTRVFLSFAAEDSATAELFAQAWDGLGVDVFRFDDPTRESGRVVEEIERELAAADLFVVLLSPHYLTSRWCRLEWDHDAQATNSIARQRGTAGGVLCLVRLR